MPLNEISESAAVPYLFSFEFWCLFLLVLSWWLFYVWPFFWAQRFCCCCCCCFHLFMVTIKAVSFIFYAWNSKWRSERNERKKNVIDFLRRAFSSRPKGQWPYKTNFDLCGKSRTYCMHRYIFWMCMLTAIYVHGVCMVENQNAGSLVLTMALHQCICVYVQFENFYCHSVAYRVRVQWRYFILLYPSLK